MHQNHNNKPSSTLKKAKELGFQYAGQNQISEKLQQYQPFGSQGVMRDAFQQALLKIIQFEQKVMNREIEGNWKYIHVLFTSGKDTNSTTTEEQLQKQLQLLSERLGNRLQNIIISLDSEDSLKHLTKKIINIYLEYHSQVQDGQIYNLMKEITNKMGIQDTEKVVVRQNHGNAKSSNSEKIFEVNSNHAVIFTIEGSQAMTAARWDQVQQSTAYLMKKLYANDLVCAQIYNDTITCITASVKPVKVDTRFTVQSKQSVFSSVASQQQPSVEEPQIMMTHQSLYIPLQQQPSTNFFKEGNQGRFKSTMWLKIKTKLEIYDEIAEKHQGMFKFIHVMLLIQSLALSVICPIVLVISQDQADCRVWGIIEAVNDHFSYLLIAFACTYGAELIRSLFYLINKKKFEKVIRVLLGFYLIEFIVFILAHFWRFSYSALVCSRDISTYIQIFGSLSDTTQMGHLILAIIILEWIKIASGLVLIQFLETKAKNHISLY